MDSFAQQKEVIREKVETYLDGKTQEIDAEGLGRVLSTTISGNAAAEIIDLPCHVFRRCF